MQVVYYIQFITFYRVLSTGSSENNLRNGIQNFEKINAVELASECLKDQFNGISFYNIKACTTSSHDVTNSKPSPSPQMIRLPLLPAWLIVNNDTFHYYGPLRLGPEPLEISSSITSPLKTNLISPDFPSLESLHWVETAYPKDYQNPRQRARSNNCSLFCFPFEGLEFGLRIRNRMNQ